LLHNLLIASDLVKCFAAPLTKTEILRNDLSVITIFSAKLYVYRTPWESKWKFFGFNTISATLNVDLGTFHFRRLHKFAIKALLRNIRHFFTADSDMKLNITQNSLLFRLRQWLRGWVIMLLYMHIVYIVRCHLNLHQVNTQRLMQLTACWAIGQYTLDSSI